MGDNSSRSKSRNLRRGAKVPTVSDVARLAGVSPMTVSRVVNRVPKVQASTRERVEKSIAKLGYVPNLAARSLAGGRQCRIALLHSNPSSAYLSEFLVGSLAEVSARNAQLIVEHCVEDEPAGELVAKILAHLVDAVLLPPPLSDNLALTEALHAAGLPIAQVATGAPSKLAHAVTIDDEAAAFALTHRLVGLGHRRIGFIGGNTNQTASALRRQGYYRALAAAGIEPDPQLDVSGDFSYRSGLIAARTLLDCTLRPSAIFASNDDMAAAVIASAHRSGLNVPHDLAVCGFDDTASATMVWPELTTARQPVADMARLAVSLLVSAVTSKKPDSPRHERLDFTLVVRASDNPQGGTG